ncbi:MAG: hypothetical protein M1831_006356 [Alyxoria varia]|nr:MAG: hypothetical protein M1831_006356 [Alyxoria varia]
MPSPSPSAQDASKKPAASRNRSPNRTSASTTPSANSSVNRIRSVKSSAGSPLSAKGAARKPIQASNGAADDSKAENASLIDDLKEQLRMAEVTSEEHQKENYVLQSRLDEALNEQGKLEEKANESQEMTEDLRKEKQDLIRRNRDLTTAYENDKAASMKEREEAVNREEELRGTIQRLKDTLAQRDIPRNVEGEGKLSRTASLRGRSSPRTGNESSAGEPRDNSQNNSKLLLQKDQVIENLRLELAEAQIKLVEMENSGGGHLQDVEKMLLEARMSNAKLMEDNESYQVLLSEKTLNGDFSRNNFMNASNDASEGTGGQQSQPGSSLADELETASEDQSEDQQVRRLESELSAAKDQNKALTVYINKIISRILANEQFEQLFENGSLTGDTNPLAAPRHNVDTSKEQKPRTSNEKDPSLLKPAEENSTAGANAQGSGSTFLQRAGSIFGGRQKTRPRPHSLRQSDGDASANSGNKENLTAGTDKPLPTTPTNPHHLTAPNQDPNTAPSLPIRRTPSNRGNRSVSGPAGSRGHRRATSEISANAMHNMNKGPSEETTSPPGAMSPGTIVSPRQVGSLGATLQQPPPLILEGNERDQQNGHESDATQTQVPSVADSGYGDSVQSPPDAPSSPRSAAAAALEGKPLPRPENERQVSNMSGASNTSGGAGEGGNRLFAGGANSSRATQNKMRPLRLVQEKAEADEAALAEKKKSNRSSFMGWFNRGSQSVPGVQQPQQQPPQAVAGIARQDSVESRPSSGGKHEGP